MPITEPVRPIHPSMEGYTSVDGPNLAVDWPALGACLGEPLETFMPSIHNRQTGRPDKQICEHCPDLVRDSCLLDGLTVSVDLQTGRRAGLTDTAIKVLGKNLRDFLDDGSRELPGHQTTYLGETKKDFYSRHKLALPLVHEWMRWDEEVKQHGAAKEPTGVPPVWPTELAIQLRDRATQS